MEIMSFGGGIQTVAMALMCINGDLPMPNYTIFADPQWELEDTYTYLSWFIPYCESKGMKFRIVTSGNIRKNALDKKRKWVTMPLFTYDENGNRTGLTDAKNNTTGLTYDSYNNQVGIIDALGNQTSFSYDENGISSASQTPREIRRRTLMTPWTDR